MVTLPARRSAERKQQIGQPALERAERRSVDGVDDDGHAGARGGQAAEQARLAAVGVDNIGPAGAEQLPEPAPGQPVLPRVHGADQLRHDGQQSGAGRQQRLQGTFRAPGGAGDQLGLEGGLLTQAKDRGDGVFLRAADN